MEGRRLPDVLTSPLGLQPDAKIMINQSVVYCPDKISIETQNALFRILEQLFSVRFGFAEQDRHDSVGELLGGVQPSTRNGSGVSS